MDVQELLGRNEITQVINRMAWCQDHLDWDALHTVLAPELIVEYPPEYGGRVETVTADHQIASWRAALEPLDASQHVLAGLGLEIDGDECTATINELGVMRRSDSQGAPIWRFGGALDLMLHRGDAGWRITRLAARPIWVDGNLGVMTPAG